MAYCENIYLKCINIRIKLLRLRWNLNNAVSRWESGEVETVAQSWLGVRLEFFLLSLC